MPNQSKPDILTRITADKRAEVAELMRRLPLAQVRDQAAAVKGALPFAPVLRNGRPRGAGGAVNVIAELKLRSPSKGQFPFHGDVARQVRDYERGGAKAISVVTDERHFGGSTALLQAVKREVALPVLQKEFLLEPWQVYYARALGADAALLIAAILPGGQLADMIALARDCGLATLVEVIDESDFRRAA